MKIYHPFLFLIFTALLFSCENDPGNRNPYLQEVGFSFELNLNLPLYNNLNNIGNPIYVGNAGVGTRGAFVMQVTSGQYFAFEASCPNHVPNDCSTMQLDGIEVECSCEGFRYNLFNGQQINRPDDGMRYYDLLFYRATLRGNSVIVTN